VEVVANGQYHRTIRLDGETGTVSVANDPARRSIRARIDFPKVSSFAEIVRRIRRVFDLSTDPEAIAAHLSNDPALAPLVARRPGLRVPGAWDGLELGIRAILGQQITVVAARNLAARLVAAHGGRIRPAAIEGLTHAFPEAETLAQVDFTTLGMPGARARALAGLAARIAADPGLFGPGHTLDEIEARLSALPGVGVWTAQYIAMRAMREPDAFPAADVGLMRALTPDGGLRPTAAQLLTRAEAWRPWRAYAALHLWTSLADPAAASQTKETTLAA
jgi:AraC family transcriptional regulator of adaptative response / DNA-3-methyladenine glycosylase II